MSTLLHDLRYGLRLLLKTPLVTLVAVLTLTLGIGVTTAIFSVVNAGLLRSLPYPEPERLLQLTMAKGPGRQVEMPVAYPNYVDWRAQNTTFAAMAMFAQSGDILWAGGAAAEPINVANVSANFFPTLGVRMARGRAFTQEEEGKDRSPLVLSYASWQKRFGGRADITGQSLRLGDASYTVIGVLPRDFEFAPLGSPEMFILPPTQGGMITRRNLHWMQVLGQLKPGVTLDQANADLRAISARLAQQYPVSNGETDAKLVPLREVVVGNVRPVLLLLFAAAGFVLLIAGANIANVLLARAAGRTQELAIRVALGARRRRLVQQLLTESALLALVGGAAGVAVAAWGVRALVHAIPAGVRDSMPFMQHAGVNMAALLFTALVSMLTGIAFGLAPALRATPLSLSADLSAGGRTATDPRQRVRAVLVVGEIAMAAAMLVMAGLLLQTLWRVLHADPGFNRHNLLVVRYALPPGAADKPEASLANERAVEAAVNAVPGVQAMSVTSLVPLTCQFCNTIRFKLDNQPQVNGADQPESNNRTVTANYFAVLQAKLARGRTFNERDTADAPQVVIVNRALEKQYFNGDALGHHLTFTYAPGQPAREIVGVVDDINEGFLDAITRPALYEPFSADPRTFINAVVRTNLPPAAVADAVRKAVQQVNPGAAIFGVMSLDDRVEGSVPMFLRNLPAWLVSAFATLALLLAALGVYGVIAYSVAQRTREFGVRMALGAGAGDLLRLVMRGGVRLTVLGTALGLVAGALLGKVAASLLFGVRALDLASLAAATVVVTIVSLAASYLPARRAARLDPLEALRYE